MGEFSLKLLHLLISLRQLARERPGMKLLVVMLKQRGIVQELQTRLHGVTSEASAPATLQDFAPLLFPGDRDDSPLRLRWCDTWPEASSVLSLAPVSALYLPSLTWLQQLGTIDLREHWMSTLLNELGGATMWPPKEWDELAERKDRVYSIFNKFMLLARWVTLASCGGDVDTMATALLSFCNPRTGAYFVKGSYSSEARCARKIAVVGGKCPELVGVLREFINKHHQLCVGIQPFEPHFHQYEVRTWLVVDPETAAWRQTVVLHTNFVDDNHMLTAQQQQPMWGKGLRIAALVDAMLEERSDFFAHAHALGIPALRVDCGYTAAGRAFLSEFAVAGDGCMWSDVHKQDLAFVVGDSMGSALGALLV